MDIFDNTILCKKCNTKMQKAKVAKNGFLLRAVVCPKCKSIIIHPNDEQEYNKFINLRNKQFKVKMRLVGNSYAVSIPKEIVSFMQDQEKIMDDMVRLCFEEMGKLSLNFGNINHLQNKPQKENKLNIHIKEKI
jgi:phage FluMu protein Com